MSADRGKLNRDNEDREWLVALREGKPGACEQLYSFLRERVLPGVPLGTGVSPDDVVADTASTVWFSLKTLRDDSKFFAFVTTIARRIASRRRREATRYASLPEDAETSPVQEPDAPRNVEREELLEGLVGSLRKGDQRLFRLLYVVGAASPEIKDALRVSPEMLRKRKHRLHLKLRQAALLARRPSRS